MKSIKTSLVTSLSSSPTVTHTCVNTNGGWAQSERKQSTHSRTHTEKGKSGYSSSCLFSARVVFLSDCGQRTGRWGLMAHNCESIQVYVEASALHCGHLFPAIPKTSFLRPLGWEICPVWYSPKWKPIFQRIQWKDFLLMSLLNWPHPFQHTYIIPEQPWISWDIVKARLPKGTLMSERLITRSQHSWALPYPLSGVKRSNIGNHDRSVVVKNRRPG